MPLCARGKDPTVKEMYEVLLPYHADLTVDQMRVPANFVGYKKEYWERLGGRCQVQAGYRRLSTGEWYCWKHGGKDRGSNNDIVSYPEYKKIKAAGKEAAARAPVAGGAMPGQPVPQQMQQQQQQEAPVPGLVGAAAPGLPLPVSMEVATTPALETPVTAPSAEVPMSHMPTSAPLMPPPSPSPSPSPVMTAVPAPAPGPDPAPVPAPAPELSPTSPTMPPGPAPEATTDSTPAGPEDPTEGSAPDPAPEMPATASCVL
jgi:hypothetical protein